MNKKVKALILLTTIICLTGCVNSKTNLIDNKNVTNNKVEQKKFTVKDTAVVNNTKIKINSVKKIYSECSWEYDGECYSLNKPENDYFLLIDLTIENDSNEEKAVSSLMQFDLKFPNGEKASQEYMLKAIKSSIDGSIMPNDLLKGQIAFDVADEDYYYLYYQDEIWGDSIKFVISKSEISE